jgi:hypothetical protein
MWYPAVLTQKTEVLDSLDRLSSLVQYPSASRVGYSAVLIHQFYAVKLKKIKRKTLLA